MLSEKQGKNDSQNEEKISYSLTSYENPFYSQIGCMHYIDVLKYLSKLDKYYTNIAKEDQTNIEDKIKEVQKAIDEIDLTRFDIVVNDEPTNDDTAEGNDPQTLAGQNPGQGQGPAVAQDQADNTKSYE